MKKLLLLFDEELPEPPKPEPKRVTFSSPNASVLVMDGEPIGVLSTFEVARERPVQRIFTMTGGPQEISFGPTRRTFEVNVESMVVDWTALDRAIREQAFPAWMSASDLHLREREVTQLPNERGVIRHRMLYDQIESNVRTGLSMGCLVDTGICTICDRPRRDHVECDHEPDMDSS